MCFASGDFPELSHHSQRPSPGSRGARGRAVRSPPSQSYSSYFRFTSPTLSLVSRAGLNGNGKSRHPRSLPASAWNAAGPITRAQKGSACLSFAIVSGGFVWVSAIRMDSQQMSFPDVLQRRTISEGENKNRKSRH